MSREDYNPAASKWKWIFASRWCMPSSRRYSSLTYHTWWKGKKIQYEFIADSKLKPSTLYQKKKLLILKTDNLLAETEQVEVDHLRTSKIYHQKMPYHAILLSPGAKCKWITKRINTHSQKAI